MDKAAKLEGRNMSMFLSPEGRQVRQKFCLHTRQENRWKE